MSYRDTLNYLAQKTLVVELCNQWGGRVAVCPEWNGRVMTSAFEGIEGDSFGCVNVQAIENEIPENFGGEDQWTISPRFFSFQMETLAEDFAVLHRTLSVSDAEGIPVEVQLSRKISLLDQLSIDATFGSTVADFLNREDISSTVFCTENTVTSLEKASIASRLRGMFNANPNSFLLLPTLPEDYSLGKSAIQIDYLGGSPHGRVRQLPQLLLIHADGQKRCQVTLSLSDLPSMFGAIDLRSGMLTLWKYDLSDTDEQSLIRLNNADHLLSTDWNEAVYYEVNCFSSAYELLPGDSMTYCQTILHLNADNETLSDILQQIFDVSLDEITKRMLR